MTPKASPRATSNDTSRSARTSPAPGAQPRALATSPDGAKVYLAIFESGNRTTAVPRATVSLASSPYAGVNPPPNSGNAFDPPRAAGQPLPPQPSANEISPEALAKVSEVEKTAKKLTLMELTEKTCKWPVGDPATDNFWFCGLPVQQGKPYCEAHVGVAFQPMSARRDRRR